MRRAVLVGLVLLILLTLGYGYTVTRRERVHRQLVAQGDHALAGGDPSAAVTAFSRAIARKPESMVGYLKRGAAHHRRGDHQAAAADLATASQLDSTSPRTFELRGDVAWARERYDEAAEHFTTSIVLDDRSPRVLYKLGLAHHVAGRSAEAQEALTRAVEQDGRFAEAHYLLGLCLRDLGHLREAEQSLKRAIALSPGLTPAREELAGVYGAQDRRLARIAELEQLLTADPTAARHVSLADAYAAAGQTLRAVRLLRRAIDLYPDQAGVYLGLGKVWLAAAEDGRDEAAVAGAVEALERAAALEESGAILTELGRAYLAAHNRPAAALAFRQAVQMLPVNPVALLHAVDLAEQTGDLTSAQDALREYDAVATDLDEARRQAVRQRIGDLSLRAGQPAAAARWYALAADSARSSPALLVRLADAHRQAGDMAAARAALARVFEREPAHPAARALERQLRSR